MTYNLQNLRIESHSRQALDGARMILPGHLNRLLEIHPSKGVLLVDLRSSTDFERSHIHDAINLRAPLSFVEHTSLEMIEDTFMDDQSRRSFSKWSQFKAIVFYDRVIEFDWECPVAEALFAKFRRKGWQGQCFILKGHYREFSASFDKHISGAKMTSEAKEYLDGLRQQPSLTEVSRHPDHIDDVLKLTPPQEEAGKRDDEYVEFLNAFAVQNRVPMVDLIPARKMERARAVEQHQKELEVEFEARFPALYKKAQAMRPVSAVDEQPTSTPRSPPPPFDRGLPKGHPFKDVDWTRPGKEDDTVFEARKAPLVGPLVSGLEKMRDASHLAHADPGASSHAYHEDYPQKPARDLYAEDGEHDYDEIDPKSEGLRNDPGFQKAGAPSPAGSRPGTAMRAHERAGGGEDTLKKPAKKRPQIWERLRSGGGTK